MREAVFGKIAGGPRRFGASLEHVTQAAKKTRKIRDHKNMWSGFHWSIWRSSRLNARQCFYKILHEIMFRGTVPFTTEDLRRFSFVDFCNKIVHHPSWGKSPTKEDNFISVFSHFCSISFGSILGRGDGGFIFCCLRLRAGIGGALWLKCFTSWLGFSCLGRCGCRCSLLFFSSRAVFRGLHIFQSVPWYRGAYDQHVQLCSFYFGSSMQSCLRQVVDIGALRNAQTLEECTHHFKGGGGGA